MAKNEEAKGPRKSGEAKFVKSKATIIDLKKAYTFDSRCLGSGAFGKVYLATNKSDPTIKIAVKMMKTEGLSNNDI